MPHKGLVALLLIGVFGNAPAEQTPFPRSFAPQDGLTAPIERAFRQERCLNGRWQFQPVAPTKGATTLESPKANGWDPTPIRIPSPWNVNRFPTESKLGGDFRCFPSYPEAWEHVEAGWLRRAFTVPADWRGKRLILRFNAVAGDTQVFVNGRPVAHHFDLFLPFEIDVTDAARFGAANELLVGVRKASLSDVQGKYGRRTYQGGSMWGQAIAGIWQDVFLTAVPAVRVANVFVKPDVGRDVLSAEVTLRNDSDKPLKARVVGEVFPWIDQAGKDVLSAPEPKGSLGKRSMATEMKVVNVPAHGTVSVTVAAPRVGGRLKTWSPESPNLYGLVCRVEGQDAKYTRFGWRQLAFQGTKVLLNGKPLVMRGDSWHFMGIPQMTRRYAWAWFRTLHDAGLNAVRLHAQPYPSIYLDMADEMGILVLDETAVWASDGGPKLDDSGFWTDTQRHLRDLIHQDRNHPSVFGWSVSNEVMAVVRNVFHAPKEVEDQADRMNGIWAAICRAEDPTRVWISADGEEDGHGALPVSVIHYGDRSTMQRAIERDKPWGVGEAGPAYYGSPKQIAQMAKDPRAYLSFQDRMEGVAKVSYESLKDQNELGGSYRSVFNLVWYGLKPLELGLRDPSRPPSLSDGISFPAYREGQPGVQPERLGPYCTTLNPGYDPRLPLYATWPLFDAIRAAALGRPYSSTLPPVEVGLARKGTTSEIRVLAGPDGTLARSLTDLGATVSDRADALFVDGVNPPGADAKSVIDAALTNGKTVVVWGADAKTLSTLNKLLPRLLTLTDRVASSLVAASDPLTAGLAPGDLYFSETNPSTILSVGLSGPLLEGAKVVLAASNVDWRRWNGQGETVKTAMVLRSEREAKPSGAAMAEITLENGRLIVCNLPVSAATAQAVALNRTLLGNLGIALGEGLGGRNLLTENGCLSEALCLGSFGAASVEAALAANPISSQAGRDMAAGIDMEGKTWTRRTADPNGRFETRDEGETSFSYFSLWLYSPKALDNLLLDPHLPKVELSIGAVDGAQVWRDGNMTKTQPQNGGFVATPLLLQQGWNHILIKAIRNPNRGREGVSIRLSANQTEFLPSVRALAEKP